MTTGRINQVFSCGTDGCGATGAPSLLHVKIHTQTPRLGLSAQPSQTVVLQLPY